MYVRTYVSVTLRNVNLHTSRNSYVTCTDTGEYWMPSLAANDGGQGRTALLDNGGRVGQRGWSSATYAFCGVEYRMQLTVCGIEEQKSRYSRRQDENKKKCKRRKHAVESLHKPGINYTPFMFDSTVVVLELHGLPACAMRRFVLGAGWFVLGAGWFVLDAG